MDREACGLQSIESQRVEYNLACMHALFKFYSPAPTKLYEINIIILFLR